MRKTVISALVCLLCLSFVGCKNDDIQLEQDTSMQTLADRSYTAKEFADGLFASYIASLGDSDYSVVQTAYGFITGEIDSSLYSVGYLYNVDGKLKTYGYKISVDDSENCTVVVEGVEVSENLFGESLKTE